MGWISQRQWRNSVGGDALSGGCPSPQGCKRPTSPNKRPTSPNGKKMPGNILAKMPSDTRQITSIYGLQFACKYVHFIKILEMCGKAK
jgi:hypothetical protein